MYTAWFAVQLTKTAVRANYCNADSIMSGVNVLALGSLITATALYFFIAVNEYWRTAKNIELAVAILFAANFAIPYMLAAFWTEYCYAGVTNRENVLLFGTPIVGVAAYLLLRGISWFQGGSHTLLTPTYLPNVRHRDTEDNLGLAKS